MDSYSAALNNLSINIPLFRLSLVRPLYCFFSCLALTALPIARGAAIARAIGLYVDVSIARDA